MVTAIVTYRTLEPHIRRYDTLDPVEAKHRFTWDWINGDVEWQYFEFYGPKCSVRVPAFTPEFLERACLDDEFLTKLKVGYISGNGIVALIHGSDEHIVSGYFVPHEQSWLV